MSEETDRATAERLVAEGITWEEIWAATQRLALERGEWAGYPIPVEDAALVIEPRHPGYGRFNGVTLGGITERVCGEADVREDQVVLNHWYSRGRGTWVWLYREGADPTTKLLTLPAEPAAERLTLALRSLEPAARAWSIEAEMRAFDKLGELIGPHRLKLYYFTGSFPETSSRSGVTYLFRRLRPTLALRPGPEGTMRCLAALCAHPLAFYERTYAGAHVPTDDVIAHLLMIRGDEHRFWRTCNQHPIEAPEAGV
mgnify:CR=1 FL=1